MIIAEIPKNAREIIRVEVEEYKGHRFISCRVWAKNNEGESVPTRKGMSISLNHAEPVLMALCAAHEQLKKLGV